MAGLSVSNFSPRAVVGGLIAALCGFAVLAAAPAARAGHEVPYYPSYYPQEIRIEPLDPQTAARELADNKLHAYIGSAPRFAGEPPAHLKSVVSLGSFFTVSFNPQSRRMQDRAARCQAADRAVAALARPPGVVAHRYPVTPYHADYIAHVDRVPAAATAADGGAPALTFRTADSGAVALLAPGIRVHPSEWDVRLDEVPVSELMQKAHAGFNLWPAAPWAKEGWFQAYQLLRPAVSNAEDRERADGLFDPLTRAESNDLTRQLDIERGLVAALTRGCERVVVGYRLRREFYNDDFSNGIENIAADSQAGLNSPVFLRTVKLKDFPWNGWLRVGVDARAAAAWNPVAGFTDAPGRLVWATVGDDAFLPIPYNSLWAQNRVDMGADDKVKTNQAVRIPAEAVLPALRSGRIDPVGPGKAAMAKITYRVSASAFHDGSEMEPADLLFPYALAFRWGAGEAGGAAFDPEIAAATDLMRDRLRGVRIARVEERKLAIADLTFTYRSPIVELYLDHPASDAAAGAALAPPWSSVPWHVLALMEAAVERGIGAFSKKEAERRRLPWLDLVRDRAQRTKLAALIKEFANAGYRPAAIERLVSSEAAKARWQALERFLEANSHLLVTNGAYRLKSWSPEAFVFDVVRDFTYPMGLGTFDPFAYPARALITGIERAGNRVLVAADVEVAVKQQRDRRIVRTPLKRDSLRETVAIRPVPRYVIVGADGRLAAAGTASWQPDGRFAVPLPTLPSGDYTLIAAILLDGNAIDPAIGRFSFRSN